jgi:hypothetical protein
MLVQLQDIMQKSFQTGGNQTVLSKTEWRLRDSVFSPTLLIIGVLLMEM